MTPPTEKPLRIVMVTDVYDTARNGGAVSTHRFAQHLAKKHHVHVITTGEPAENKSIVKPLSLPFVSDYIQRAGFTLARPNKKILQQTIASADVVHILFPFWLGISALNTARQQKKPVIASFHVQAENIAYNSGIHSTRINRKLYQLSVKYFYGRADHIIYPSLFAQNELSQYHLTTPGTIIPNGVPEAFQPKQVERPKAYQNKFILLMVGRLTKEKRQDNLIKAIDQSQYKDDIQLILVGSGINKRYLEKLGQRLPHPPHIVEPDNQQLLDYYNMADLYVHASDVELESLTILEAMASGLPALISNAPKSASQQFALNDNFLYQYDDIRNLSQKVDYWFKEKNQLKAYRQKALQQAQHYPIAHSVKQLEQVYYRVMQGFCQ